MWSPRNLVKAFDMWVLSVLQEENKLWLKTKLCSRNCQHNRERLVQIGGVRPELAVWLKPLAVAFHETAMLLCGNLEAYLIASCLNLVLELTTHKYLYKCSVFIYNTLVESFRSFLSLKFLIEGVWCLTVKVRKILWALKLRVFKLCGYPMTKVRLFFFLVLRIIFCHLGMVFDIICL